MPALSDLVNRTRQMLLGFSQEQQQYTFLTTGATPGDVTFTVDDASQVSRGLIEIDGLELCLVKKILRNNTTAQIVLDPFGRGWAGTTAATHAINAKIENNPVFPTIRVVEAINDTIRSVYPNLFGVGTKSITKNAVVFEYDLAAAAEEIISVQNSVIGPTNIWPFSSNWRFVGQANTGAFPSGKALYIGDDVMPGQKIFVTYMQEPVELVNLSDDFAGVTTLPATAQDVIIYGACMKLTPSLEGARLTLNAIEASERSQFVQAGAASRVSTYFGQLYNQRLEQEAAKLRDRYPRPTHFDY
jgi:hypothetical protein